MPEQKRQTAYKIRIRDILDNEYIRTDDWSPNYFLVNGKKVSRVNIIGTVVSDIMDDLNFRYIMIDDGSGKIPLRDFDNSVIKDISLGDVVLVIGKPREYGKEKYIVPEIIKKIEDKRWLDVRKKELEQEYKVKVEHKEMEDEEREKSIEEEFIKEEKTPYQEVCDIIKEKDKGEGVSLDEINIENAERIINDLLLQGEVFEVKPGRYKLLE